MVIHLFMDIILVCFCTFFSLLPVSPLGSWALKWTLPPMVLATQSHWTCNYFSLHFPGGFCHTEPPGRLYYLNYHWTTLLLDHIWIPCPYSSGFCLTEPPGDLIIGITVQPHAGYNKGEIHKGLKRSIIELEEIISFSYKQDDSMKATEEQQKLTIIVMYAVLNLYCITWAQLHDN